MELKEAVKNIPELQTIKDTKLLKEKYNFIYILLFFCFHFFFFFTFTFLNK